MNPISILLQAPDGYPQSGTGQYSMIIMIIAMLAIFYFLLVRPSKRRKKQLKGEKGIAAAKEVEKRYPALRILANCFSFIAWLVGFLTACTTLFFILEISKEHPDTIVLGVLVTTPLLGGGAVIFALLLVAAEQIKLNIDIEENTRKQLQVLLDIKKLHEQKITEID